MEARIVAVPEWTAVTPRRLARLFRAREMRAEGKGIVVQVVERELAGPRGVSRTPVGVRSTPSCRNSLKSGVRILDEQPKGDRAHLMLELKLHVKLNRVAAVSDIVRWIIGAVTKGQREAKLPCIEIHRSEDVPRAENGMGGFEHGWLPPLQCRVDPGQADVLG